jgi:hypothetical protein
MQGIVKRYQRHQIDIERIDNNGFKVVTLCEPWVILTLLIE